MVLGDRTLSLGWINLFNRAPKSPSWQAAHNCLDSQFHLANGQAWTITHYGQCFDFIHPSNEMGCMSEETMLLTCSLVMSHQSHCWWDSFLVAISHLLSWRTNFPLPSKRSITQTSTWPMSEIYKKRGCQNVYSKHEWPNQANAYSSQV